MPGHLGDEQILPMLDGAVIGGLGGLVNYLRKMTTHNWGQLFVAVLTAAFAGMLAQLVAGWWDTDIRFQYAVSGIAGYGGGVLLDDVVKRVRGLVNTGGDVIEEAAKAVKNIKEVKGKCHKEKQASSGSHHHHAHLPRQSG